MALDEMTVADSLAQFRAALTLIQPGPFNAEARPAALAGQITPARLHYVRSHFAVPRNPPTPWGARALRAGKGSRR